MESREEQPSRSDLKEKINFGFVGPMLTPYIFEIVKTIQNMLDIS
jgi:hypothetical protein